MREMAIGINLIVKESDFKENPIFSDEVLYINSINPHSTLDKIADYERISETEKMYFDNLDEARKMRNNILTILKILSYGFIIVISLIGITNIFNAVSASIILKKREFASLLSYGMTNKQFKKMNLLRGYLFPLGHF